MSGYALATGIASARMVRHVRLSSARYVDEITGS
jgi:hypothetical protein